MTTIIDEEVEQLWNIAASLRKTKKRLSNGKNAIAQTKEDLPFYRAFGRSVTNIYENLILNTEWLFREFVNMMQAYEDVNSLIKKIDEKICTKSVMSKEDLEALTSLGKDGSVLSSSILTAHYKNFDRAAKRYRNEWRGHSDGTTMSRTHVKSFEERMDGLIDGAKIAIEVSDQADLFMTQILELLPPLRLQKGRIGTLS